MPADMTGPKTTPLPVNLPRGYRPNNRAEFYARVCALEVWMYRSSGIPCPVATARAARARALADDDAKDRANV